MNTIPVLESKNLFTIPKLAGNGHFSKNSGRLYLNIHQCSEELVATMKKCMPKGELRVYKDHPPFKAFHVEADNLTITFYT
jgi:hypothetical protein